MAKKKKQPLFKKYLGFVYVAISAIMIYGLVSTGIRVFQQQKVLDSLKAEKVALEKEKKTLSEEVSQLNDDEYVTRYARDHYIFSADGEEVVILPDTKK